MYKLMKEYDGALENKFSFSYDLSSFYLVFSQKGMSDLMNQLSNRDIFLGIYVWEPYSLLVGCCKELYFLLDTFIEASVPFSAVFFVK